MHRQTSNSSDNRGFSDLSLDKNTSGSSVRLRAGLSPAEHEGCVVLAKGSPTGHEYITGYRIDRAAQRAHVSREILKEALVPCCTKEGRDTAAKLIWNFIRSEAFLLTIHLTAILLGVLKGFIHKRAVDEKLHIAQATLEAVVALLLVVIRTISGRLHFREIPKLRLQVECVEDRTALDSKGFAAWMKAYVCLGVLLAIAPCVSYGVLYHYQKLEFTILTNQFVMVMMTLASGITMERINLVLSRITQDHHKALLHEGALLLGEAYWYESKERRLAIRERVNRFIKGLGQTDYFEKPGYISLPEHHKPQWDSLGTVMLTTGV